MRGADRVVYNCLSLIEAIKFQPQLHIDGSLLRLIAAKAFEVLLVNACLDLSHSELTLCELHVRGSTRLTDVWGELRLGLSLW